MNKALCLWEFLVGKQNRRELLRTAPPAFWRSVQNSLPESLPKRAVLLFIIRPACNNRWGTTLFIMKQEKKSAGKKPAQQAAGNLPATETRPAERVAKRDPLARIAKYVDHDTLVALADYLETIDPAAFSAILKTLIRASTNEAAED